MAKATIVQHNGAPQLLIDGKPHPPMGYFMKWKDPENHLEHIRQSTKPVNECSTLVGI